MFKAMSVRECPYTATCTLLREESFSLCFHSKGCYIVPQWQGGAVPPLHMHMLVQALRRWRHSVFFIYLCGYCSIQIQGQ